MILCSIGLHKWVYSHPYEPNKRVCLRCGRLEAHNWPLDRWFTPEELDKVFKSKVKPTFNEEYRGGQ